MTTVFIPVLVAMYLGSTFNLVKFKKGNFDVYDEKEYEGKLQVIDRSFTRSQYKLVETSTQAREFLDVSGALSLRIKKGDISVDGTGDYLKDTANRQKFVELLIRVQHETVTKTIPSDLKPKTDWMSKNPEDVGTHYVRSITYGGELIASLQLKANNYEEREIIKAAVGANLQLTGTFDFNANGSFSKLRKDLAGMYNEKIKVMATTSSTKIPQTVEELMEVVENYPKEVNSIEGGIGRALRAELYPLSSLKADFSNYLPNKALTSLLNDVETKYDDIRTVVHEFRPWNLQRKDSTPENEKKVEEFNEALTEARKVFNQAINDLDLSINGSIDQFKKAFEAYGTGKNNIPNRFQRWFWKLRHETAEEHIIWEKPHGSGVVYINWGSKKCPSAASSSREKVELLYSGQVAGSIAGAFAAVRDYKCLRDSKPALSKPLLKQPKPALVDSVEYRSLIDPENKSGPIPCAACYVPDIVHLKTFYAQTSCPRHWRKEYSGITMGDSSPTMARNFMCLNKEVFSNLANSEGGNTTAKLNPVWLDCNKCDGEHIAPCIVCSYGNIIQI